MKNKLTLVAIITRTRAGFLDLCLASLARQSVAVPQLLVVDNDVNKTALPVVKKWQKHLSIDYVVEPRKGAPTARNTVIALCKTGWLAFIDDDAIADKDWMKYATLAVDNLPESHDIGFIVGQSRLANPNSVAAQAQHQLHQIWFKKRIKGKRARPETLDTKNCLLNCAAIHRHRVLFDQQFVTEGSSGLEDTDFGIQLSQLGYSGQYQPQMQVYHAEKDIISGMLKKAYLRGMLRCRYDRKWQLTDPWIENAPHLRLYSPPYFRNLKLWAKHFRWMWRNLKLWKLEGGIRVALMQELYLAVFNQGYLDERRMVIKS